MSKEMWCEAFDRAQENLLFEREERLGRPLTQIEEDDFLKKNLSLIEKMANEGVIDAYASAYDRAKDLMKYGE